MPERAAPLQGIYRWELAKLLLSACPCRLYDLARVLDCTERQVKRYFDAAREVGYVLTYSSSTRCWRLEGQRVDRSSVRALLAEYGIQRPTKKAGGRRTPGQSGHTPPGERPKVATPEAR